MRYFLTEIAQIVGGRLVGCDLEVASVATDSRSYALDHNTLFVAMRGVNHDAHDHIAEVAERGIKAFMVEREVTLTEGCGAVVVENSLTALQALAEYHRTTFNGKVIGITGSNGKTTVKEWIAQCAPSHAKIFRSPRSYNSQLGVALSLHRCKTLLMSIAYRGKDDHVGLYHLLESLHLALLRNSGLDNSRLIAVIHHQER